MRRSVLALFVLASSCSALVACSGDESPGVASKGPKVSGGDTDQPAGTDPGATTPTATPSCAGIADAKLISPDAAAGDLRIDDGAVFFRSGTKVIRAAIDGSGQVSVYDSEALVRSFVTAGLIVSIEEIEPPNAVVKVTSMDDPDNADPLKAGLNGAQIPTAWNAGGSYFIGADADSVYAVGDEQQGEVIYKLSRANPIPQALATVTDTISSAQIAGGSLWYVRDRTRVFQIPLANLDPNDPEEKVDGEPKEVFGSGTLACALAVGTDAAFCSGGTAIERRDLSGANPKTLLEANKSKVAAPFGSALWNDGTLYVRTSAPDANLGHAIRALKASGSGVEERVVACGRTAIGEVVVGKEQVVWTEPGKGVFVAPR